MPFSGIIGLRKTENELEVESERFSGAPHAETEKSPFTFFGKRRGIFKACPELWTVPRPTDNGKKRPPVVELKLRQEVLV